jgi:thiosulfate/3-mercaptopyruvate sulfurtransferase
MSIQRISINVLLAVLSAAALGAQATPTASRRITPSELAQRTASETGLVLLQVGSPAQFVAGHVPGARPVSLNDVSTTRAENPLFLEVPPTAALERWARSVGLSSASRVVIVPSTDTLQLSTRVLFTLEVMGFGDRVQLLDGGVTAWRAAGFPVDTGAATPLVASSAPLSVARDSMRIAVIEDVAAAVDDPRVAIVDARLPSFYAGQGGGYPRPGHIPTAINIPLSEVAAAGVVKSAAELRRLFLAAGVRKGERIIVYCHIGQQASLVWFAAREAGFDARIFDGSFQQWSGSDRPVVAPPAGGR